MKTEIYGDAKIEPYGVVQMGTNVIEFTAGMAFLNNRENDIGVERAVEMVANYISDIEIIDNGDKEPWIAVLINERGGLRFLNGGAFHLFCRSLVYTDNG